VFKLDWGGEGDTVFLVKSPSELEACLDRSAKYEASGQFGFMIQKFIPSGNRSLRVAVIGDGMTSYWRTGGDQSGFLASISKGGHVDPSGDPDFKKAGEKLVAEVCRRSAINLAGMDVIFAEGESAPQPQMLEINYFFGRVGLGGSEEYYRVLKTAIKRWVRSLK